MNFVQTRTTACLQFFFLFFSLLLSAQVLAYSPACQKEVMEYCASVQPGEGRQTNCVAQNRNKFSVSCRPEVHAVIEQRQRFATACKENADNLCPGIKPGKGRLYACLKFNQELLTATCRAELE